MTDEYIYLTYKQEDNDYVLRFRDSNEEYIDDIKRGVRLGYKLIKCFKIYGKNSDEKKERTFKAYKIFDDFLEGKIKKEELEKAVLD